VWRALLVSQVLVTTQQTPPTDVDDWDAHWAQLGATARLNPAQRYRRQLCLSLLERRGTPRRLLDVGSGTGEFLGAAGERWPGIEMIGLEMSRAGVEQAAKTFPSATFLVADLLAGPGEIGDRRGWATHAVCCEVLEHVDDPVALVRSARQWLAHGARVVVTVPGGPMSAYDRHIGHRRHFTPSTLRDVLEDAGLEVVLTLRAGFPWFNVYRGLVILAGERLVSEADVRTGGGAAGRVLNAAMLGFRPLFATNLPRSPFGWQMVAVAREPC
jgi:SAM-dependent methyltransferase